jgi:hypothetical protein
MQRNVKIMQRSVTRTAQWMDVCPDCRSVLKLTLIEAHPNHDKLGIYRFGCENCGKSTSKTIVGRLKSLPPNTSVSSRYQRSPKADRSRQPPSPG